MKKSKWSKYDTALEKAIKSNPQKGYSDLAKIVLGDKWKYRDVDLLRTYARRKYGDIRDNLLGTEVKPLPKIMVYDIETSLVDVQCFWTGDQYINHKQLKSEPKIITIAWKWLGEEQVHHLTWDKNQCDKKLMEDFLLEYNSADVVMGVNNKRFDDKWINTRAMKYGLSVNVYVKSYDIQQQARRVFRLPSYSMAYISEYCNVTVKQSNSGITMWEKIQKGNKAEQKKYMAEMVDYNIGDIVTTEELYFRLRPYLKSVLHTGVFMGEPKWSCPDTGSHNVELFNTSVTPAGTVQRIMISNETKLQYKISDREYLRYIDNKK